MEQELLYAKCIIGGKSHSGLIHVAVSLALLGNNIFVGICKALHDENCVCQLDSAVTVGVAVDDLLRRCSNCCGGSC